jgi:hypothetical protein
VPPLIADCTPAPSTATAGAARRAEQELSRLVGAVLAEQTEEWADGRRYVGLDVLIRSRLRTIPATYVEEVDEQPLALTA